MQLVKGPFLISILQNIIPVESDSTLQLLSHYDSFKYFITSSHFPSKKLFLIIFPSLPQHFNFFKMSDPLTSSLSHSPSVLWFSSLLASNLDPIVNHFNPHLQILPIALSSIFFSCMHLAKPESSYIQLKHKQHNAQIMVIPHCLSNRSLFIITVIIIITILNTSNSK